MYLHGMYKSKLTYNGLSLMGGQLALMIVWLCPSTPSEIRKELLKGNYVEILEDSLTEY